MALLELVSPWDSQPQEAVEIDWNNPITRGLFDVMAPPGLGNSDARGVLGKILNGSPGGFGSPLANNLGPVLTGRGLAYRGVNGNCGLASPEFPHTNGLKFTSFCRIRVNGVGANAGGFFGYNLGIEVGIGDGTNPVFYAAAYTGSPLVKIATAITAEVGQFYDIATVSSQNNIKLYINGALIIDQAQSYWNGEGLGKLVATAFMSPGFAIDYLSIAAWQRELLASEVASLNANPWQLFSRREWVPFGAGGGGGAQTLTPALFTNAGAFYSATVSQSGGAQTLTPSLYTNPNAFYPATVARGAVSLAPSLFTNSNTFYSATVSLGGSPQTLTPALFSNAQTFFSPTVGRGAVNLAPALFTNTNTFYSPVITNGVTLRPSLLTNSQTFYGASITLGPATLRPALLANSNQFFAATLTGGVVRIKQKGLRKTRYTPGRVPADAKELPRFVQNELERLTDGLESPFTHQLLGVLHAEPSRKPQDSVMVAFADGTDWNPGAGRGLYLHDPLTSTWTKL